MMLGVPRRAKNCYVHFSDVLIVKRALGFTWISPDCASELPAFYYLPSLAARRPRKAPGVPRYPADFFPNPSHTTESDTQRTLVLSECRLQLTGCTGEL